MARENFLFRKLERMLNQTLTFEGHQRLEV